MRAPRRFRRPRQGKEGSRPRTSSRTRRRFCARRNLFPRLTTTHVRFHARSSRLRPRRDERIVVFFAFVPFRRPRILPAHPGAVVFHPHRRRTARRLRRRHVRAPSRRARRVHLPRTPYVIAGNARLRFVRRLSRVLPSPLLQQRPSVPRAGERFKRHSSRRPRALPPRRRVDRSSRRDGQRVRVRSSSRRGLARRRRTERACRDDDRVVLANGRNATASRARLRLSEFVYRSVHQDDVFGFYAHVERVFFYRRVCSYTDGVNIYIRTNHIIARNNQRARPSAAQAVACRDGADDF